MSKKVAIDPGHGGYDSGATGHGYKEKGLALKFTKDVYRRLEDHKVEAILTRYKDEYISLGRRSKTANEQDVLIFLSVHLNSASVQAKGLETYHFPRSAEGRKLATLIQEELVGQGLCLDDRGVKSANFSVLRETEAPAALLELCFINNKEDLQFFLDNYSRYVEAVSKAILTYLGVSYKPAGVVEETPIESKVDLAPDKLNIMLMAEHMAVDGFIKDGTSYVNLKGTYLAIREIFEAMHLRVGWDNELGVITADTTGEAIREKGLTDVLILGNKIDVKTFLHEGQHCLEIENAYIPIRDIFETLGLKVSWDASKKLIVISR